MEVLEALNILKNSLNEAVNYWDQIPKMKALNDGTRGFNAKAASDEKLRVNRQVCLDNHFDNALKIVEDEMLARGLIKAKTGATQPQPAPQPQIVINTEADRVAKDFEIHKDWFIPSADLDWKKVAEAKAANDIQTLLDSTKDVGIYFVIRRFIIAALLGYTDIQEAFKKVLIDNGFKQDLIKAIITHVIANKEKFKDLLAKYKVKKESFIKLTEEAEDFDVIQYIPQEKDFQKVCESMKAVAEDGLEFCSLKLNPDKVPGLLRTTSGGNPAPLIRRFIASSLLGWELLSNNLKAEIKKMGVTVEEITKILKAVMAEKSLFIQNFIKYKPIFEAAKKKTEALTEAIDTDVNVIFDKIIKEWDLLEALNEETNNQYGISLGLNDFHTADALFIKDHINDPKVLIENCIAATGTVKHVFITLILATIIGAPASTCGALKAFLTTNCGMSPQECKEIIIDISTNSDIRNRLQEIKQEVASASAQAQNQTTAQATTNQTTNNPGSRSANAGVTNMGVAGNFCRLVIYDTSYNPPARRHLYVSKKVGNTYAISVGGSQFGPSHSWYDEPLFDSLQQALDFIHNVNQTNIKTVVDTHNFKYNITDKPIDLGTYQGNKIQIADLSNAVLVDTACGPAYIQRKNKKCVESLTEAKEENLEEKVRAIVKDFFDEKNSRLSILEYDNGYDGFVEEFGEDEDGHKDVIDFGVFTYNKLTNEDIEKGKPVITFLLSGGLNGSGKWEDYLKDVSKLFKRFEEELDIHAIVYKMDTDIADDVWTAEVLLYIDRDTIKENLNEDLIVINERHAKEAIEELKSQIEKSTDWKVRKNLLTLMDVYLFQTIYESDHQEETGCDINKDEWEEYSKWHTKQGEKLAKEHPEVLEKEKEWEEEEIAAKENAESGSEEEHEETEELKEELWPKEHNETTVEYFETDEVMKAKVKDWLAAEKPCEFQIEKVPEDLTWEEVINAYKEGKEPRGGLHLDTEPREYIWQRACELYYLQTGKFLDADFERMYKEKRTDLQTPEEKVEGEEMLMAKVGTPEDVPVEEPIEEDVEKHKHLNPKLFDNNHLKPEVREKCLEIVDEFAKNFTDPEIPFNVKDIIITGSNASYNYTKDSDIDLHIIADTSELDDPNKLYPLIYDAYKSIFNSKMDISIYGIPVEIYVETEDSARVSNGVYSVKNDAWLQEPVETIIPEIDWDEFMKAFKPWEDEYKKIVKETEGEKSIDETPIDEFIDKVYELRQQGLQNGGEYSFENLIFKELRNRGHLERLKDLKNRVIANRLSLKSLDEAYLDDEHKFFDYKTAEVADDEYIDVHKGSNFSAQDLLDGSTDKAYEKLDSKIEQITPKKYFAICSRIQGIPAEELIKYVEDDQDKLEHLVQVIKVYNKKFPIPYANFVPNTEPEGQEGKHRMYVLGELFGWDTPFPVQIIRAKK